MTVCCALNQECTMARLIITGVILSILIGVAVSVPHLTDVQRTEKGNAEVEKICNEEILKKFIKCDAIPRVSQDGSSNPRPPRGIFSNSGGVFFATVEQSPSRDRSNPSGDSHSSDLGLIWKVNETAKRSRTADEENIPVREKFRVALKFRFEKNDGLRRKEEEKLDMLRDSGLAPTRYVLGNGKKLLETDVIIMERIDGMTLPEYIAAASEMSGLEGHDEKTRLRLPGLRLLYIHKEIVFLLERLQKEKMRHGHLLQRNVMVRKSTIQKVHELEEQLKKDKQRGGQEEEAYQEDWLVLQFEARLVLRQEGSEVAVYQTNNDHMVFVGFESAKSVYEMQEADIPSLPDISSIFANWKTELTEVKGNPHLTLMKRRLKKIFAPLAGRKFIPPAEERRLEKVIEDLKVLEKAAKSEFIAHLRVQSLPTIQEVSQLQPAQQQRTAQRRVGMGEVLDLLRQQIRESKPAQSRPQYRISGEATKVDKLALRPSNYVQVMQQTQAKPQTQWRPLPQENIFMGALTLPSAVNLPHYVFVTKEVPKKLRPLLPRPLQPLLPQELVQREQQAEQKRQAENQQAEKRRQAKNQRRRQRRRRQRDEKQRKQQLAEQELRKLLQQQREEQELLRQRGQLQGQIRQEQREQQVLLRLSQQLKERIQQELRQKQERIEEEQRQKQENLYMLKTLQEINETK